MYLLRMQGDKCVCNAYYDWHGGGRSVTTQRNWTDGGARTANGTMTCGVMENQ